MKKVLIVDDNVSFTEFLDATVRAAGHETCISHNGTEALEAFEAFHPDLVFLDVLLPKMDGFKVCSELRRNGNGGRTVPIVLMTGIYTKGTYKRDARRTYGATDYLVKPFAITDVWQVLEKTLGSEAEPPGSGAASSGTEEATDTEDSPEGVLLRDRPLPVVLAELHREGKTGLLFLKGSRSTDVFFLDEGELVFVRSSDISQRLDHVLRDRGIVTEDQLEEARRLLVESRGQSRMGKILVSLGYLDRSTLRETVQDQLLGRIHAAFRNPDLAFSFLEGPLPEEEDIRVHLDMPNLILEGIREMPDEGALQDHLPPRDAVLARGASVPEGLHLTGYERQVLALGDGHSTVDQALAVGGLAEIKVDRTLFALLTLGLLRVLREGESAPAATADSAVTGAADGDPPAGRERRPFPLPPQGDLRVLPPARVVAALHHCAQTGVLELRGGDRRAWIYIENGDLIFARSDSPEDRLGAVLVEGGLLQEAELERVARLLEQQPDRRMGQILVDEGLLGLEELRWAVVFQVQRIISHNLARTEGRYGFKEGPLPTQESITVDLNTPDLLLEGLRRVPAATARRYLPQESVTLRPAGDVASRVSSLGLTARERDLWQALDKQAPLADLRARFGDDAFVDTSLHLFLSLGLLQEAEVRTPAAPSTAPARSRPEPAHPETSGFDLLEDLASEAESAVDQRSPKPAAGAPKEGKEEGSVPRFLYDQLLRERRGLEATLYEARTAVRESRDLVQKLHDIVDNFRTNVARRGEDIPLSRLDPLLEEMSQMTENALRTLDTAAGEESPDPGGDEEPA